MYTMHNMYHHLIRKFILGVAEGESYSIRMKMLMLGEEYSF